MKITAHFNREEFDQPARHGLPHVPYPEEYLPHLRDLCEQLEVIRAEFDSPITITSGYRTPQYNKKIKGARFSQHLTGRAADIVVRGASADEVHTCVLLLHKAGRIHLGGLGKYENFVHVDVRPSGRLVRWGGLGQHLRP